MLKLIWLLRFRFQDRDLPKNDFLIFLGIELLAGEAPHGVVLLFDLAFEIALRGINNDSAVGALDWIASNFRKAVPALHWDLVFFPGLSHPNWHSLDKAILHQPLRG